MMFDIIVVESITVIGAAAVRCDFQAHSADRADTDAEDFDWRDLAAKAVADG